MELHSEKASFTMRTTALSHPSQVPCPGMPASLTNLALSAPDRRISLVESAPSNPCMTTRVYLTILKLEAMVTEMVLFTPGYGDDCPMFLMVNTGACTRIGCWSIVTCELSIGTAAIPTPVPSAEMFTS